ncbi:Xylose isomerase-like TIM barrel [Aquisphaera giovannonii]|uniref:Xylose isomerase-like TIM barrel n=1 Tax=Aquisphaera giovannonii TaxID=406548 RepID=A0A5B9W8B6_9BACT|nr:sugar phosphate isomerase/epimerase family protein [Aquisphaera giovannonii]QEH36160.1 Xylose isomerase-like TIM barrel [Aquisphaera giovannonii]
MARLDRRAFLGRGALAAVSASAAGILGPSGRASAIPPIGRTRPSHMKLSLAAYSYRDLLTAKPPRMDLFGYADLAADMGLDAIEPTSYYFPADAAAEYLRRLRRHAFLLGLDISGTAIGNNFCLPPGPRRDAELAHARLWIDRAAELNAPVIRIFSGSVPKGSTEDQAVDWAVAGIKESLAYAAGRGVMLALENHGGITATPAQLLRLVKAVDAPNFGVNLDTGNFHVEDPYAAIAELAPFAINVQVKTEVQRQGKGKEEADLARIVAILREARYSGYVALEYEADEDPLAAVPRHIKTLRQLIG